MKPMPVSHSPPGAVARYHDEMEAMIEANRRADERRQQLEQQLATAQAQCIAEQKKADAERAHSENETSMRVFVEEQLSTERIERKRLEEQLRDSLACATPRVGLSEPEPIQRQGGEDTWKAVAIGEIGWLREQLAECRKAMERFEGSMARTVDSPGACETPRASLREQVEHWKQLYEQAESQQSLEMSLLRSALDNALQAVHRVSDESAMELALKQHKDESAKLRQQLDEREEERRRDEKQAEQV